jgi:hypothetical protein
MSNFINTRNWGSRIYKRKQMYKRIVSLLRKAKRQKLKMNRYGHLEFLKSKKKYNFRDFWEGLSGYSFNSSTSKLQKEDFLDLIKVLLKTRKRQKKQDETILAYFEDSFPFIIDELADFLNEDVIDETSENLSEIFLDNEIPLALSYDKVDLKIIE